MEAYLATIKGDSVTVAAEVAGVISTWLREGVMSPPGRFTNESRLFTMKLPF